MSRMFSKKRISILTILLVVLSSLLAPATAYAYDTMDSSRNGNSSLTIQLPAPSSSVKLYFVADMDEQTKITMKEEYSGLGVTLDNVDSSEDWAKKAEVLANQLIGSDIKPIVTSTDEGNKARFENLSFGIYLVVVDNCEDASYKYTITPNFISVPNSTDGKTWIYDVNATLKYEVQPTPTPGPDKVKFAVRKTWTNDGEGIPRPTEIVIAILRSYEDSSDAAEATESSLSADAEPEWEEVETVKLNAGNNWYYAWEAEADGATWTVKEVTELSNYSLDDIKIIEDGDVTTFTLINRYLTPTPTPTTTVTPTPSTKVTATPTPSRRVTATPTPRISYKATATPRPNVTTTIKHTTPKTGDDQNILLPVIGILAAGLVLVLLGMNIRKKSGKDE